MILVATRPVAILGEMTTLEDLLKLMREVNENVAKVKEDVAKDVAKGNKELRKDIKEDNMKLKIEVSKEITALAGKVEKIQMNAEKHNDEDRARTDRLNKRMSDIEKEVKRNVDQTANRERIRKIQDKRVEDFLEKMGLEESLKEREREKEKATKPNDERIKEKEGQGDENVMKMRLEKSSKEGEREGGNATKPNDERMKEKEGHGDDKGPTNWTRRCREQLEEDARKGEKEKESSEVKKGMRKLKKWFGDESPDNTVSSESDSGGEEENWEEKVNRRQRNNERRKRNLENRRNTIKETATKASLTLGIQPVKTKDIEDHLRVTKDPRKARELAVRDYLRDYLQFNEEELEEVEIKDTKISSKGEETVYVVFGSIETIRDIHWRVAEVRNKEIVVRNFIPPQFWSRYMYLNKACSEYRGLYPNIKTQLRFGSRDVEIMMKEKGSKEPYKKVTYSEVTDPSGVPGFDHSVKWTQRQERKPRRKLIPADNGQEHQSLHNLIRANSTEGTGILRQRSNGSISKGGKKPRYDEEKHEENDGMDTEENEETEETL